MTRTVLLTLLLATYASVLARRPMAELVSARAFDPLAPRPRAVEQLLVAGRYADALPLVVQLQSEYPREPLVAYWLSKIHSELNR